MNYFTKEKRYNTLDNYYKSTYHTKVFKVSLDAGFSCPNKNSGGCTFCSDGSAADGTDKRLSLHEQFDNVKSMLLNKWPNAKTIAYFQSNTNTYADLETLKKLYLESLSFDKDCIGIDISTRPDCLTEDLVKFLAELDKTTDVTIELGLQSSNNETLKRINRGHTFEQFLDAVKLLNKYNIKIVVHIINGLPGETYEDMINTIKELDKLDIFGLKIHMLHINKNTKMYEEYLEENFHILDLEEYVKIVVDQLELLNDRVIISRLSSDDSSDGLVAPLWINKKLVVMNEIDKEFRRRDTYQGIYSTHKKG